LASAGDASDYSSHADKRAPHLLLQPRHGIVGRCYRRLPFLLHLQSTNCHGRRWTTTSSSPWLGFSKPCWPFLFSKLFYVFLQLCKLWDLNGKKLYVGHGDIPRCKRAWSISTIRPTQTDGCVCFGVGFASDGLILSEKKPCSHLVHVRRRSVVRIVHMRHLHLSHGVPLFTVVRGVNSPSAVEYDTLRVP
jgi:hypothetical protein